MIAVGIDVNEWINVDVDVGTDMMFVPGLVLMLVLRLMSVSVLMLMLISGLVLVLTLMLMWYQ